MWETLRSFGPPIVAVFFAAVIARKWQHRNWLVQQRISDVEKRYSELKLLYDEFVQVQSARLYRMQRLLSALKLENADMIELRLKEYDAVLLDWNDKTHTFIVRLHRNMSDGSTHYSQIDETITQPFVAVGAKLENVVRAFRKDKKSGLTVQSASEIEGRLRLISSAIFESSRDIYKALQEYNDRRLDGEMIEREKLAKGEYWDLTYGQLLNAIFRRPKDETI